MGDIVIKNLDNRGLDYVMSCLAGGDDLARELRERLPIGEGAVWTPLPADVEGAVPDLRYGGFLSHDEASQSRAAVVEFVRSFLEGDPARRWCAEERTFDVGTPDIREWGPFYTVSSKVLWCFDAGFVGTLEDVWNSLAHAGGSYLLVAALTTAPAGEQPPRFGEVGHEWLAAVAEATSHIVTIAWDEEGCAIWSRGGVPQSLATPASRPTTPTRG